MIRRLLTLLASLMLAVPVSPASSVPAAAGGALASANVEFVANIPDLFAVGSKRIGKTLYVTTFAGVRIYDLSLGIPVLKGAFDLPHLQNEDVDTDGEILLVASDHFVGYQETLYVFDVSLGVPILKARLPVPAAHTATCIQSCRYAWLGGDFGKVHVVDLANPAAPKNVGWFGVGGSIHDVQVDSKGIAWISTSTGLWAYRTTSAVSPSFIQGSASFDNDFIIHNSLRPYAYLARDATSWTDPTIAAGELLLVTEEDWLAASNGDCAGDGSFQTGYVRQKDGSTYVAPLDAWHVGQGTLGKVSTKRALPTITCSSHYFGFKDYVASVGWYEQGVRFLSVKNPRDIRQVGYWLPLQGMVWSAHTYGDYTYVFDAERGLDVIKFSGSATSATVSAPTLMPMSEAAVPSPTWGMACRIPV